MRQVEGRYKVKDATMRELHAEVKRALAGFDGWTIRHVRRERTPTPTASSTRRWTASDG